MSLYGLDTYLGWDQPEHRDGCKRPSWEIGTRTLEHEYRSVDRYAGEPEAKHSCPAESCEHGPWLDKTVVRLVCKSCGAAHIITGEKTPETRVSATSVQYLAYGLPPRQMAGLLLWPAQPWLDYGRLSSDEPYDFVVTRTGVKAVTREVVVGQITQGMGKLKGRVWTTLAVPNAEGPYGLSSQIRYAQCNDGRGTGGSPLRTVRAAARWIGARLAEAEAAAERAS
ncbi:hypothetical protein [Streptomyces antibioticus]|uniref:hypothetical protein n=1 Tax=Streptomyces antibioticus TaxID=1890 RepID=UPI003681C8F4